jgi:SAM-dependent methyltransferase
MNQKILDEQLAYYRARAGEYDLSLHGLGASDAAPPEFTEANREWTQIVNALHTLAPAGEVLELACGTGIWTRELRRISSALTALDGSPEMIALNRAKIGDAAIRYHCADLFTWEPDRQVDLVFFAFWISHVPPTLLGAFLEKAARATKPGGHVFIVDEPKTGQRFSGENFEGVYQQRSVQDGRTFQIVKVYYDPQEIESELQKHGFQRAKCVVGKTFFYLDTIRRG